MALLPNNLADILTTQGFYKEVRQLAECMPVKQAYQEAERTHESIVGRPRYTDFESFNTVMKRLDQKR